MTSMPQAKPSGSAPSSSSGFSSRGFSTQGASNQLNIRRVIRPLSSLHGGSTKRTAAGAERLFTGANTRYRQNCRRLPRHLPSAGFQVMLTIFKVIHEASQARSLPSIHLVRDGADDYKKFP
jgi:hypothetical protein